MNVWNDIIAINETEIVRLKAFVAALASGTLRMQSLEGGKWTSQNAAWSSEDNETIYRLEALVARAKLATAAG